MSMGVAFPLLDFDESVSRGEPRPFCVALPDDVGDRDVKMPNRVASPCGACPGEHRFVEAAGTAQTIILPRTLGFCMSPRLSYVWPRLVIVEGIMGSGKSTATLNIAHRLNASGIPAIGITEGVAPHPIRFDWDQPWSEMPPAVVASSGIAKWRAYVSTHLTDERISIVDGQLFHGGLTALLLLEAGVDMVAAYCRDIVSVIQPLSPLLIYFHQTDVDRAIRVVSAERGEGWVDYQVNWKLESPYAKRRGLAGLDGLIALYREYRALTDELYASLDMPKISIENSRQEWAIYDDIIDRALTSPPARSSGCSW
jgi:hypothetical protein